jgi:hypothetical protein
MKMTLAILRVIGAAKIFSLHRVAFKRRRLGVPMLSHHFRDSNRWSRE